MSPPPLMTTFGADLVGNQKTLPRKLLQQLKKHRGRAALRREEERRERLASEIQKDLADRGSSARCPPRA